MSQDRPVLSAENLTKRFGHVTALDGVSLEVNRGEWVSVMGPSGSGKTTLLNLLSLLEPPTSGRYVLDDVDTSDLTKAQRTRVRREKIGLVFQQFHLVPYLTALENVMLAQYYHSSVDEDQARQELERIGLGQRLEHLPSQLSGGEQQRVCLARALINGPAIILADEPTGNLDEDCEREVLQILRDLHAEARTIVLVTHNPELGGQAERTIYLHHGRAIGPEKNGSFHETMRDLSGTDEAENSSGKEANRHTTCGTP
jgi:putative ABC transport system ATP-binding protein